MGAQESKGQQGPAAASSLALLDLKRITKLTDAAQELFSTLYALERAHKIATKVRLAEEFAKLDLFGPSSHYADHEDYQPEERGQP